MGLVKIVNTKKPICLISLGISLIAVSVGWRLHQLRILSFFGRKDVEAGIQTINKNLPMAIRIKSVGISLAVAESLIVNGVWEIPPNGAGHLNTSSGIGSGNMVIYAHNKKDLFGPIRWVKKESIIEVTGGDGEEYNYQVFKIEEVTPDKIEYVLPKNEEILTLYTCSGLFDSRRFIVLAKRI